MIDEKFEERSEYLASIQEEANAKAMESAMAN